MLLFYRACLSQATVYIDRMEALLTRCSPATPSENFVLAFCFCQYTNALYLGHQHAAKIGKRYMVCVLKDSPASGTLPKSCLESFWAATSWSSIPEPGQSILSLGRFSILGEEPSLATHTFLNRMPWDVRSAQCLRGWDACWGHPSPCPGANSP